MKKAFVVSLIVRSFAGPTLATPIAPGETLPATVAGSATVYQIFGHAGNPGGRLRPGERRGAVPVRPAAATTMRPVALSISCSTSSTRSPPRTRRRTCRAAASTSTASRSSMSASCSREASTQPTTSCRARTCPRCRPPSRAGWCSTSRCRQRRRRAHSSSSPG